MRDPNPTASSEHLTRWLRPLGPAISDDNRTTDRSRSKPLRPVFRNNLARTRGRPSTCSGLERRWTCSVSGTAEERVETPGCRRGSAGRGTGPRIRLPACQTHPAFLVADVQVIWNQRTRRWDEPRNSRRDLRCQGGGKGRCWERCRSDCPGLLSFRSRGSRRASLSCRFPDRSKQPDTSNPGSLRSSLKSYRPEAASGPSCAIYWIWRDSRGPYPGCPHRGPRDRARSDGLLGRVRIQEFSGLRQVNPLEFGAYPRSIARCT